ncbi:MAG: TIR domain-containing protein [Pseudomonadota bacterium]
MADPLPQPDSPIRVFLSYSRRDTALMLQIAESLRARGFEPDFDQSSHDPDNVSGGISAEDEWWLRLQEMIAICDVMVFLASPASANSDVCDEELVYARQTGKRIIPVLTAEIDFAAAPPRLAALNVKIDATQTGEAFETAMDALQAALNVNVGWRRDGRRLADRMAEWDRRDRPASLLLRPGAVEDAEAWAARRPRNEPEPGDIYFDYVSASRRRNRADEKRRVFWRRITSALVFVAIGLMGWGLFAMVQTQRNARINYSQFLTQASMEAYENDDLARAMRLSILASKDTVFSPAADGAQFQLGRATMAAQIAVLLPDQSATREPPLYAPTAEEVAIPAGKTGVQIWRPNADMVWSSVTLSTRSDNPDRLDYSADGTRLFTASHRSDDAEIWRRIDQNRWEATKLNGHETGVNTVAFSPNNRMFVTATGSYQGAKDMVLVWQTDRTGEWFSTPLAGHTGYITSVSFASDGDQFATSSRDGTVRIWRKGKANEWLSEVLPGAVTQPVEVTVFSPTQRELIALSSSLRLWRETATNIWEDITPAEFPERVDRLYFSPTGNQLAVYDLLAGSTAIWRRDDAGVWTFERRCPQYPATLLTDGTVSCAEIINHQGTTDSIRTFRPSHWIRPRTQPSHRSLSSDGHRMAMRNVEGAVLVSTLKGISPQPIAELIGHENYLTDIQVSADGRRVITASEDSTARIWQRDEDGDWQHTVLDMPGVRANVTAAAFAPDGEQVVAGAFDRLWLWHHDGNGQWTLEATLEGHEQPITSTIFSPDGAQILSASEDRTARIWTQVDANTWSDEVLAGHGRAVRSAAFSPDGLTIITGSDDGVAAVWQRAEPEQAWAPIQALQGHGEEVVSAVFSPSGDQILTESTKSVRLWEKDMNGAWSRTDTIDQGVIAAGGDGLNVGGGGATFSPSGDRVLTHGDFSAGATLWHRDRDGVWIRGVIPSPTASVEAVAFFPSGRQIITADADHIARIWDISWLTPDEARRSGRADGSGEVRAIVDEACEKLRTASMIEVPDDQSKGVIIQFSQAQITAVDIERAPILKTMGAEIGMDVCEWVEPGLIDRILTLISRAAG